MAKVFIGMPVYNGARFITKAINSIRDQKFTDWKLLISDNGSTDETGTLCRGFCAVDERINYYRQNQNIGAEANFKFLLDAADSEYFVWMASDDVWYPDFLIACVDKLERDKFCGMAFTNIISSDSFGRAVWRYPDFSRFAHRSRRKSIHSFLHDPEILGKANLIYSVYRLDICRRAWRVSPLTTNWGSDMSFVLAVLARTRLSIDKRVLFDKRYARSTDREDRIDEVIIPEPEKHIFPLEHAKEFIGDQLKSVSGTKYHSLTNKVMQQRLLGQFGL